MLNGMREIKDLKDKELKEYLSRGVIWYQAHADHVQRLVKEESATFEPYGADMTHPALWKARHWNWFFTMKPELKPKSRKRFLGIF